MRRLLFVLLMTACLGCSPLLGAPARIIKVLPHLVDAEGRHALSPSLYERDAYQAHLRKNRKLIAGLRFDIQWRAPGKRDAKLKLRVQMLTSKGEPGRERIVEQAVRAPTRWSRWTRLMVAGRDWEEQGNVVAWRATLWDGDSLVAEQNSFLWRTSASVEAGTK